MLKPGRYSVSPTISLVLTAFLSLFTISVNAAVMQVGVEHFGAGSKLVNFDTTPDGSPIPNGTLLGSIYSTWGVTFGPTNWASDWAGIPVSLPNRATSGGPPGGRTDCYFPAGVSAVGAWGFDFVLSVFDENENLLGSIGHTDGTVGIYGTREEELGFLGLASDQAIHHAIFSLYWSNQTGFGFEIDDLHFTPWALPTATDPSTWGAIKRLYR